MKRTLVASWLDIPFVLGGGTVRALGISSTAALCAVAGCMYEPPPLSVDAGVQGDAAAIDTPNDGSVDAEPPGCGLRLIFRDGPTGAGEVYAADPDGTDVVNLSSHTADDAWPSWSPLGDKVLFESNRDGNWEVYAANATGGGVVNMTVNAAADRRPEWSPDGTRIAFNRANRLYVMDANGGNVSQVSTLPIVVSEAYAWAPDSERLVMQSGGDLYVVTVDADEPIRLTTDGTTPDYAPSWSPDGTLIAHGRLQSALVVRAPVAGSSPTTLSSNRYGAPSWASDSSTVLFTKTLDGVYEIDSVRVSDQYITQITTGPSDGFPPGGDPTYSPDGEHIAFARRYTIPGGSTTINEIGVVRAGGTSLRRFQVDGNASYVRWAPCLQ